MYSLELSENEVRIPLIHWKGPQNTSPVFHWAHATGFNGETYRTLLEPLSKRFNVYAWDLRGHGRSLENTSIIKDSDIYTTYVKDLSSVISSLYRKHNSKIFLGGHSIGATISISAAAENIKLIESLLLVDPVIFNWYSKYLMNIARILNLNVPNAYLSQNAKRRRREWPNIENLIKSYEGRGAFKTWKRDFLIDYIRAGTTVSGNSTFLSCHPEWESRNFKAFDSVYILKAIRSLKLPVRLLLAQKGSTTKSLSAFRNNKNNLNLVVENSTHFIPMEFPEIVQKEILDLLIEQ